MNRLFIFIVSFIFVLSSFAQEKETPLTFTNVVKVKTTPVKNQQRTGTCWSFATTSFVETEILRMGGPELDLSEMYNARHAYEKKADLYVRFHGKNNFGPGGQAHDVMNVIRKFGIVPVEVYTGKHYGDTMHNHGELNTILLGFLDGVIKNRSGHLTPVWKNAYSAILDIYLGPEPETFTWNGNSYSPASFRDHFHLNPDDYVELTSYLHHPFYKTFELEVPDNFAHDPYYNIPLDELIDIMKEAVKKGYSVAWDGDVSEKGFSHKRGLAILPPKSWAGLSSEEVDSLFKYPDEMAVTPESRQQGFDNYSSTDDHLMHIVGTVTDETGKTFFVTKNSWGTDRNNYGGYLYMSEPFVRDKTLAIMVHKDVLPKKLAAKLGIK
ncbi:MAG: aminopeptidase [Chlorobi bacterium]|nr:aminopeptidase [Chlorobiota bacterium]